MAPRATIHLAAATIAIAGVLVGVAPGHAGESAGTATYLVVLKRAARATPVAADHQARVRQTFSAALHGFSATLSQQQAKALAGDPRVAFVQRNQRFTVRQDNPPWGLDRSDQRALPLDKKFTAASVADKVNVYVIDTGIYPEHKDFGGRASVGTDTIKDGKDGKDCHGHGSHVAGTIAGKQFGVAKGAKIFGVRVLDCTGSGSSESVVAGIEWVTKNAKKPAVVNMSLGGPGDPAMDAAVRKSVTAGIAYVVAAGNESGDACNGSPAREPTALTIGATDKSDKAASFTNKGRCVDLFGPGVDVESVGIGGPEKTKTSSGTSMASPHVAGGVALQLANDPKTDPIDLGEILIDLATSGKVQNPGAGSPNKLLYVGKPDPSAVR